MQAYTCVTGDGAQPVTQLLVQLGIALLLVCGGKRVDVRKLGPGDGNHLTGGVEFHGARAQRNHAAIQCQVFVAEAAYVAQHGGFAMVAVKDGVGEKVRAALQTGRNTWGRCGVNDGWLLGTKQAQ